MKQYFRIVLFVLLCGFSSVSLPNPMGGVVSSGQATFSQPNASTLIINQTTSKAIINWQTFNIQAGQTTQFIQPSSSSIALNRVNGLNGPSSIFGNLIANGQVWIVNPAGVVIGPSANVNVGGLLATTSDIRDQDFLSGNYKFTPNAQFTKGSIINNGTIQVQPGGLVALIGNAVENKGVIQAKMGTVVLGGAQAYTLDFDGDKLINFTIQQGPSGQAVNQQGKLMKNAVNNSGLIDTGVGVSMGMNTAKTLIQNTVNMSGVKEATHVYASGGKIILDAGDGGLKVSGKLLAQNGSIKLNGGRIKTKNATLNTSGKTGGSIEMTSTGDINLINTKLLANSPTNIGGSIKVLGQNITMQNSKLKANGLVGGGTILIGGNDYGKGPEKNALTTTIDKQTSIAANALQQGDGGKIVVWSDNSTKAYGNFSATGGLLAGNGGWIETSGGHLDISGIKVNLSAAKGKTGTWLLDPSDITISNGVTDMTFASNTYSPLPAANSSTLNVTDLVNQLANANIQVVTTSSGTANGNITIATPIAWNSGNTLTLTADPTTGQVQVNNAITASGNGAGLILSGNSISIAAPITTTNGNVSFTGATTISVNNAVTTGTGSQTYNSPVTLAASTTLSGGQITLPAVSLGANTLTVDTSSPASSITGIISDTGGLTKNGTGILTLSGVNTFTGATTINNGILSLGVNNALNSSTNVTLANVAGTTLDLNNFTTSIHTLAGGGTTGGNVTLGSGTLILVPTIGTTTYSGSISGTGNVYINGFTGGAESFAGSNTYTGATQLNGGALSSSQCKCPWNFCSNSILQFGDNPTRRFRTDF